MRWISSSVRSLVRLSGSICALSQTCLAVVRPIPYRYVSEIWICFSRGRSTPAMRAMGLLSPAAACGGGSRCRSRARRPCGGSPCTSRRSSSPKHGPSRLPPADENASKIAFLPSRTPYRGSRRQGLPGTKGARLVTAAPRGVKSAAPPARPSASAAPDLDPMALVRSGKSGRPDPHRLRDQTRPQVDEGLAGLQEDLGAAAHAAVVRLVAGGDGIAEEH